MNIVELKALVKHNALYKGCRNAADRLRWTCCRGFYRKTSPLSQKLALEIVQNQWPRPEHDRQEPRTGYPSGVLDLSVIIPVYNMEQYVDECIRSVLEQKSKYRVEVILIDDGSRDRSAEILDSYAGHPDVIVIHKKNGGLPSARNEGLKHASGNYLMFLDSDDYLGNDCIRRMLDKAYAEDCDIVQMQYVRFSGNVQAPMDCQWNVTVTENYQEKCTIPGHACMKIFRNTLFEGLFFPEGYWYEDTIVHMILFERSKRMAAVPVVGYFYRMNATGITYSKKKTNRCLEAYWIMPMVMQLRQELGMPLTTDIYLQLIKHLSVLLYHRTKSVDDPTREALFVLSANMIRSARAQLGDQKIPMDTDARWLEQAFLNRNYGLWKCYCRSHPL